MRKTAQLLLVFFLFILFLSFSPLVLAGFKRNLENGLEVGFPGNYQKPPLAYTQGENFKATVWLKNPTDGNIGDHYWAEIWQIKDCPQASAPAKLTEEVLNRCSGGSFGAIARTQEPWWQQEKHYELVEVGEMLELNLDWTTNQPGYYQFDFFSENTWAWGPLASGYFRVTTDESIPASGTENEETGFGLLSKKGRFLLISALVAFITSAGFLYLLEHPDALKKD